MLSNHLILCHPFSFCLQPFPASGFCPSHLFQWDIRVGPKPGWLVSLWEKKTRTQMHREMTVRTQWEDGHLHIQERGLRRKPTLSTSWSWTSSLQNCEITKSCWLAHPAPVTLLCWPWQGHTNTYISTVRTWHTQVVAWISATNARTPIRPCLPAKKLKSNVSFPELF